MERALHCLRFQFSGTPQKRGFGCACVLCLPGLSSSGSQELHGCTLPGCGAPSPLRGPSLSFLLRQSGACALCLAATLPADFQNIRKSLVRNWRPVCSVVADAVSRAEFAPFPSPLPPDSCGNGPVCSHPALLWTCSLPLFCERPAVCSGQLIFSLSFAIPQFKLLSHKRSHRLLSGHSGPVLTLNNATRSSPFHPHSLVADVGIWGTFLLGVAFRHVIYGFYLFFLPVGLPSEIRKLPTEPTVRGFPGVWKLPLLRLPSQDGSPSLALLSFFLSFIFCPTSF